MEQNSAINPNPVLSVVKDGAVIYSNEAGEPLLHEWDVNIGEKLPSYIVDIVHRVISLNNPERIEVKVGKRVFAVAFHPMQDEEYVNIYGFDISDFKESEEKHKKSENPCEFIKAVDDERHWLYDVLDSLPVMICILTSDHYVAFANCSFRKRYGDLAINTVMSIVLGALLLVSSAIRLKYLKLACLTIKSLLILTEA